jgi:outer membrane cobalamin receptor
MGKARGAMLAILAAGVARAAPAETPAPAAANVGELVVTALPQPMGDKAYDVVALTADTLMASPSGRLEDVLFDVAGFQEYRRSDSRSANPTSQGATLRALGGNAASRALVLLDGAPVADPFFGYIPWSALSPDRLGEVRVTRGAAAGAFGSGALAGTIEMFSADAARAPALQADVDYGSRNSFTAEAVASGTAPPGTLGGTLDGAGASLFGRFDRGDGYVLIPADQRGPVDIRASYSQGSVGAHAQAPIAGDARLLFDALAFDDQRVQGLSGTTTEASGVDASVGLLGAGPWRWQALAYGQLMNFTNRVASVNAARTVETPSLDEFDTPGGGWGGKIEARPPVPGVGEVRLGADLRDDSGHTEVLSRYAGGEFTQLLRAGGHERVFGGFAEWSDEVVRSLTLTAGGRIDRWSIDGGSLLESNAQTGAPTLAEHPASRAHWEPTARGGVAWDLGPAVRLRGAGYVGYRLPTLNELYRPYRVQADAFAANPALAPERLRGVEAGVDYRPLPALRLSATVFADRLENAIANVALASGPGTFPQVGVVAAGATYSQRENLTAIDAQGVETEAHAKAGIWSLDASYAYTHARDVASGIAAALQGLPPAQTPAHQVSATLGAAPWAGARLAVTGRYVSGQSEDDRGSHVLTGAATMDAVAEIPVGRAVTLVLRAENLLDARIETGIATSGLVTLGTPRTLWVGARLRL